MMGKFFGRRSQNDDVASKLDKQTEETKAFLDKEGPRMAAVATWLENRKNQNGLGEDFDITFWPRGAR